MKASEKAIELIKTYEGFRSRPYLCPAGKWTIGYGTTKGITSKTPAVTRQQALDMLNNDLIDIDRDINFLVKVPLTQGMHDALASFCYNLGSDIDADTIPEGLGDSTLLKKLNAGDKIGAANEILKWNKATINGVKQVLDGLTKRRKAERELFLS